MSNIYLSMDDIKEKLHVSDQWRIVIIFVGGERFTIAIHKNGIVENVTHQSSTPKNNKNIKIVHKIIM